MLPLDGVKVLDLSHAAAGPCCTMMLADMGAEVIKIEPLNGESFRYAGGGAVFFNLNRNKRGVALNLRGQEGREIALKLAAKADVFVESFTPGTIDKLGLGYNAISQTNPKIIYCSISGFGQSGPYRERPAYDPLAQAMSGMLIATGEPDGAPVRTAASTVDFGSGMFAAYAIALALLHREKSGKGQEIDVALLDTAVFYMSHFITMYSVTGQNPRRLGSGTVAFAPGQIFEAKDRPFFLTVTNERAWRDFCQVLGLNDLVDDPRYATNANRLQNRDELAKTLNQILSQYNSRELEAKLVAVDIPCGPLLNAGEVINDPQVIARKMVIDVEHPEKGKIKIARMPICFSETVPEIKLQAPMLGEHTNEILKELGYSDAEISQLAEKGIILKHM